jgi:hypothetical protein
LVTLTWNPKAGKPAPQLAEGNWLLDMTPDANNVPLATFHRVVSVGDVAIYPQTPNTLSMPIELAQPVRNLPGVPPHTMVTMDGVSEVLDCGPGWKSWSN